MRINSPAFFDNNKRNISILIIIALLIGICFILTTVVISKDGITFIHYAQRLINEPQKVIIEQDQHPGFPFLVLAAHKAASLVIDGSTNSSWIYSGQTITLLFRLLSIVVFYFLAVYFLKDKVKSFIATLIMIFLPVTAKHGSDCLSDWPHLFFLLSTYGLILLGAKRRKIFLFGIAGLCCGLGYLVRPECVQAILIGGLWLVLQSCSFKPRLSLPKAFCAGLLIIVGFAVFAGPYMHYKKMLFPKKQIGRFTTNISCENNENSSPQMQYAGTLTSKNGKALYKFFDNSARTYMYYFLPAAIIGLLIWLKSKHAFDSDRFIITAAFLLNFFIMLWLHKNYGYMNMRHTMPILIIVAIFIPIGLEKIADWLAGEKLHGNELFKKVSVITLIGLAICSIRFFKPIHWDKTSYVQASKWLTDNTPVDAKIESRDSRIPFYASRTRSSNGDYQVLKIKTPDSHESKDAIATFYSDKQNYKLIILKKAH